MRHSSCRYRIDQIERKTDNVQLYAMFVQLLLGSGLPVRVPGPQIGTEDKRLHVHESLQVRPVVQVQDRLMAETCRALRLVQPVRRSRKELKLSNDMEFSSARISGM
jgi:hypothetical protein